MTGAGDAGEQVEPQRVTAASLLRALAHGPEALPPTHSPLTCLQQQQIMWALASLMGDIGGILGSSL